MFTTRGTLRLYAERYANLPPERLIVIENGYDEAAFAAAASRPGDGAAHKKERGQVVLVHSGTVYASERDPRPFFAALADPKARGRIGARTLKVVPRATGCDEYLRARRPILASPTRPVTRRARWPMRGSTRSRRSTRRCRSRSSWIGFASWYVTGARPLPMLRTSPLLHAAPRTAELARQLEAVS